MFVCTLVYVFYVSFYICEDHFEAFVIESEKILVGFHFFLSIARDLVLKFRLNEWQ